MLAVKAVWSMNNSYKEITEDLQKTVELVFKEEEFEQLLAYSFGEFSGLIEPVIIKEKRDFESKKIVFTEDSYPMLSKYLLKNRDIRQAVVAKPCDTRAIAFYISENIIDRDNLIIIGINGCPGIKENTACDECDTKNPVIADYFVGEPLDESEFAKEIEEIEYLLSDETAEKRKKHYSEEFSRCTQCYACRDACPVCYCDHCFVESNQPIWLEDGSDPEEDMVFHLMRTMHMPGRCVNCGACEMACPEGIEMRSLTSHLYHQARRYFDYRPGLKIDQLSLFSDYNEEDPEPGFLQQEGD